MGSNCHPRFNVGPHGTRGRYVLGCHCRACREANRQFYHRRMAKDKAIALELVPGTPPMFSSQLWTAPDGRTRTRYYKRACPGVLGRSCPTLSHLRKDSTGGICAGCRRRLAWNGLVSADRARRHLFRLSRAGVGRRAVSDAADVSMTVILKIRTRRKRQIRAETERRILSLTADARAGGSLVPARRTNQRIQKLLDEGFTKTELARRLGSQARQPALQLGRGSITATNAMKVERLYWRVMVGG